MTEEQFEAGIYNLAVTHFRGFCRRSYPHPMTASDQARGPSVSAMRAARRLIVDVDRNLAVRVATTMAACGIIFWRTPQTFNNPQFWAEDGIFYAAAMTKGWASISTILAGYLTTIQLAVAALSTYFSPVFAPTIFNYTAVALTLLVVWMVTSPRLDMPAKPLLGIAVVVVPMGYEEIGALCNIQWILPIGAFALLFMHSSKSKAILAGESIFTGLMALSGPFSIFLAPLFAWRAYQTKYADQRRLIILFSVVTAGAIVQLLMIATHSAVASPPVPYDWTLWVNLPFKQIATNFGPAYFWFQGVAGVWLGVALLLAAIVLSFFGPHQTQKAFMIYFGAVVAVAGMLKFRESLGTQQGATRYFYAAAVFSLWFICCLSERFRYLLFSLVAVIGLSLLPIIGDTPRDRSNLEWKTWAAKIRPDEAIAIPIAPAGWFVTLPGSAQ